MNTTRRDFLCLAAGVAIAPHLPVDAPPPFIDQVAAACRIPTRLLRGNHGLAPYEMPDMSFLTARLEKIDGVAQQPLRRMR